MINGARSIQDEPGLEMFKARGCEEESWAQDIRARCDPAAWDVQERGGRGERRESFPPLGSVLIAPGIR